MSSQEPLTIDQNRLWGYVHINYCNGWFRLNIIILLLAKLNWKWVSVAATDDFIPSSLWFWTTTNLAHPIKSPQKGQPLMFFVAFCDKLWTLTNRSAEHSPMHNCKQWQMAKRHDVDGVARGLIAGRCLSGWTFHTLALIVSKHSGFFLIQLKQWLLSARRCEYVWDCFFVSISALAPVTPHRMVRDNGWIGVCEVEQWKRGESLLFFLTFLLKAFWTEDRQYGDTIVVVSQWHHDCHESFYWFGS